MNVTISRLKKYAECANACYALFDKEEFTKAYIDVEKNKENDNNSKSLRYITEFEKLIIGSDSNQLALDFRFRGFPEEITDFHINQINSGQNEQVSFLKQTENFLERYEIKAHQPNTITGFSATLFYDKVDDEYILAMRGTEGTFLEKEDFYADSKLFFKRVVTQYDDMMKFYEYKVKHIVGNNKLIVTGHSLGGALSQYFTISFHDDTTGENPVVQETYTFNSPGIDVQAIKIFGTYIQNPYLPINNLSLFLILKDLYTQIYDNITRDDNIAVYFNRMMENNLKLDSISTDKYVYHIESCIGLGATKEWLMDNTTQHLGMDINGQYLSVNNNMDNSMDAHGIEHTIATLYFYDYLIKQSNNSNNFSMLGIKELLTKLNGYTIYADFLNMLNLEIADIENIKKKYILYLQDLFIKAKNSEYNEPLYRITKDIMQKAKIECNNDTSFTAIIDNIIALENAKVETIYVDENILNPANNLNDMQKTALYFLYPYIVSQAENQNYHISELIENLQGEYLDLIYYIYSSLMNTINSVNQDVLCNNAGNGKCNQYDSIDDIIKNLSSYAKKTAAENEFLYVCSML
ncbi:Mbeg1-like protein [uncultured Brachyspira sp.]|uniref:Mbeg1-like protein n=1 Tax=uncultured Brachyspira sp. TaxID=221953 RepID=UPI002633F2EF|nr:Mbeg1-like protein [uncultured Brachyspira sp.]